MDQALRQLLEPYNAKTAEEYEHALKEVVQHLALLGLWRSKFFEHAAFYGGTALRIFHGMRRFSEDMDFSLLAPKADFHLESKLGAIRDELKSFGFSVSMESRPKEDSAIESAFIKGNTRQNLLQIEAPPAIAERFPFNQKIKIKLELDTDPPSGASYEVRTVLVPIPFQVRLFSLPDLFAGKLHAVLARNWKARVKGRDFYDFLWYVGRGVACNTAHLEARLRQSGHWRQKDAALTHQGLCDLLAKRFAAVDFEQAKADVRPFLSDPDELVLWSREFFLDALPRLKRV